LWAACLSADRPELEHKAGDKPLPYMGTGAVLQGCPLWAACLSADRPALEHKAGDKPLPYMGTGVVLQGSPLSCGLFSWQLAFCTL